MNRTLLIALSLLSLNVLTGCLFSKKAAKPKENPAIAAELEASFMQRTVDKRVAELTAKGMTPEAARAQAVNEFRAQYPYTSAAQK
jgi:hypothetical protein